MEEPVFKAKNLMEIFGERWVDERGNIRPPVALLTGFGNLDDCTRGFKSGEMTVLIAHASMGKTAFMMSELYRLMLKKIPAVYCTAQNRLYYTGRRMMSFALGYDVWKITEKEYREKGKIIREKLSFLQSLPAYVIDASANVFDIDSMLERVSDLMKEVSLQLVMVDDPHLMKGDEKDILVRLKHFAVDRQVPVLTSLRAPDNLPMTPQRIRAWLGDTAVYADYMLLLKRRNYPLKGDKRFYNQCRLTVMDMIRNKTEKIKLDFDCHLCRFTEMK